ncbi:chromosome segregation SMC family protein [Treponema sp. Marseille-Q3903]|uniref:chromosome segregation SMC family protein n=1 Tax=Treponema sp. Marseille-Q3903 TaxID=2766703 RepID=UPI0016528C21|nr:AAA family ATPase [Treponema sp. Marseille-Q3903]MBC6713883.1 AAA family ATPase [Treponema sp. Marseille-Q3903]
MFLKSLDIYGFKSFADKTHIDFAEGITALLGPNGCGKSNVVDAIKWVLAERNSKNLRAEKMEDVIFNGTERRPALNTAEVTLTIANDTGLLPLDEEEIAITRRLYRSGDQEYFINRRPAGPTEIRRLFLDTGIGKAAYSVMEQGKIDQILSSKPEDRRYLFEEAAGISRSKAEVAEAERELERTRQNMVQIEIAMGEIKRQYDSLKVQSEKTIKYRKYKEEIYNYELDLTLIRLKNFVTDKARREEELNIVREKRDNVRKEIDDISNTISENMDKVKAMQEDLYNKQADLLAIGKEKNGKLELIKQQNEQAMHIKEKLNNLENRKKAIEERIDNIQDDIDEQNASLHVKTKQLNDIKSNIESFEKNIEASGSQITDNDRKSDSLQQKIGEFETHRHQLQSQLAAITEDIVSLLDQKLKDDGFSESAMRIAKEELNTALGKLKIYLDGRKNIFNDYAAQDHSFDNLKKSVKEAGEYFEEAMVQLAGVEKALEKYQNASPAFITEFLSPEGIMTKKRKIDKQISENVSEVENINNQIKELNAKNTELNKKINEYKDTLQKLKLNEIQMAEQINGSQEQIKVLDRQIANERSNLHDVEDELFGETKRADELKEQINDYQNELAEIEYRGKKLAEEMNNLDEEIAKANKSVSGKNSTLNKKREEQNKYQDQYENLTLALNSADNDIRNVKLNFQEQYSRDLMEFEERMYKITTPAAEIREKLATAKKDFSALGSVNLMAPEEFTEVKDRYERQKSNYEDTQKSLENLTRVSEEIKSKSAEMFLETYNQIKKNFHNMFRRLFNGGRAELKLENPTDILTSGIDIYAQPPGKKLENIALLSGGEKTMTAVALLFATYQVRPSPFCLLDEIDAALDDKNVSSFVTALESFASVSQYIIITHNKKTVMGASTMLGITMEESGVSKIIALRLEDTVKRRIETDPYQNDFEEEEVPDEEGVVLPPRPPKRQ